MLGQLAAGGDAHARVVGVVVALHGVVAVVGGHQRDAGAAVELQQGGRDLALFLQAVVHDLQVVAVVLQIVAEPRHQLFRLRQVARQDGLIELRLQTAGQHHQTLGVLGQQFLVDARVVVVALFERDRRKLHEVLIPLIVLRQDGEMAVLFLRVPAVEPRPLRDIHLAPDDGLQSHRLRRRIKLHGPVHIAVIRHRESLRPARRQILDRLRRPALRVRQTDDSVHQRILGMVVQVYEFGFVGHRLVVGRQAKTTRLLYDVQARAGAPKAHRTSVVWACLNLCTASAPEKRCGRPLKS